MTFGKVLEEFKSRLLNGNEEKELYLIDKKSGKKTSARRKLWRKENALCLMKSLIYKDKVSSASQSCFGYPKMFRFCEFTSQVH